MHDRVCTGLANGKTYIKRALLRKAAPTRESRDAIARDPDRRRNARESKRHF
jgi:hypothetical protein